MRVLVTRPREQSQPLVDELVSLGFEPIVVPLIAVEPLSDDPIDVDGYDCVVVTSPNGARELARRMTASPRRLAAVGPGTAAALSDAGLVADVVADVHTQEGLVDALGADVLPAYRTVELEVGSLPEVDVALLMSGSAARSYARAGGRGPAISIGPQTTATARAAGIDVVAEAGSHDVRGVVDCAAAWLASSRS